MSKNKQQISFSGEELMEYSRSNPHNAIANLLTLTSQLYVRGLAELNQTLSISDAKRMDVFTDDVKLNLLNDLKNLYTRPELSTKLSDIKFKETFKDEILKPYADQSNELKEFVNKCSALSDATTCVEKISAIALNAINKQNTKFEEAKSTIVKAQEQYKISGQKQYNKDKDRQSLVYIDESGKSRHVENSELDKIGLSKQQQDFIESSWSQGTFGTGWGQMYLQNSLKKIDENLVAFNPKNITTLTIDRSQKGKVVIYNRAKNIIWDGVSFNDTDEPLCTPGLEAVCAVDISNLQGKEFVHGSTSVDIPIYFSIESLDERITLPKSIENKKSKSIDYLTSKDLKKTSIIGCLHELENNVKSIDLLDKIAFNEPELLIEVTQEVDFNDLNTSAKQYLALHTDIEQVASKDRRQDLHNILVATAKHDDLNLPKKARVYLANNADQEISGKPREKIKQELNEKHIRSIMHQRSTMLGGRTKPTIVAIQELMINSKTVPNDYPIESLKNGISALVWQHRRKEQGESKSTFENLTSARGKLTDSLFNAVNFYSGNNEASTDITKFKKTFPEISKIIEDGFSSKDAYSLEEWKKDAAVLDEMPRSNSEPELSATEKEKTEIKKSNSEPDITKTKLFPRLKRSLSFDNIKKLLTPKNREDIYMPSSNPEPDITEQKKEEPKLQRSNSAPNISTNETRKVKLKRSLSIEKIRKSVATFLPSKSSSKNESKVEQEIRKNSNKSKGSARGK